MGEAIRKVFAWLGYYADVAKNKLIPPVPGSTSGDLSKFEFKAAIKGSLKAASVGGGVAAMVSAFLFSLSTAASVIPGVMGFFITAFLWLMAEIAKRFEDGA